jgi:hypothetical protein
MRILRMSPSVGTVHALPLAPAVPSGCLAEDFSSGAADTVALRATKQSKGTEVSFT